MNKEQSQNLEQGEETSLDFLLQVDEDKEHSAQLEAPQKRARHLPPQAVSHSFHFLHFLKWSCYPVSMLISS